MKKLLIVLMMVTMASFLLVGCDDGITPPVNEAPIITSDPITTGIVGVAYIYDVEATDPDDDKLTYSFTVMPSGMTIGSATGLIKWTPPAKGDHNVTVKVSDGALDITQSFTITVSEPTAENQAPVITSSPNPTATVGVKYAYTIKATDPDSDAITYSLVSGPTGMVFDGTATICWMPLEGQVGFKSVKVQASDGALSDTQSFIVEVSAVEPEPELQLIGIEVDPKTMDLFIGETEKIESVTAKYEVRGYEADIDLEDCTHLSSNMDVATVKEDSGEVTVTAVKVGTANILVSYKGKMDTLKVTVKKATIKIDGVLSPSEWFGATEIPVGDFQGEFYNKGTVWILATADYLYAAFEVDDSTDARLVQLLGNDTAGININPIVGGACDILFMTAPAPNAWGGSSSGLTDDWETNWKINGTQYDIPGDLETKTLYSGDTRVTEWKIPLDSINLVSGDTIVVGGSVATDVGNVAWFYMYPEGLEWIDPLTYLDITVE